MAVTASISLSEQQEAFARKLVEDGRFSSVSAVVQHGLELLREETESNEDDVEALKALISERAAGQFLNRQESRQHLEDIIAETKRSYGL